MSLHTYHVTVKLRLKIPALSTRDAERITTALMPKNATVDVVDIAPLHPSVNRLRDDFGREDLAETPDVNQIEEVRFAA